MLVALQTVASILEDLVAFAVRTILSGRAVPIYAYFWLIEADSLLESALRSAPDSGTEREIDDIRQALLTIPYPFGAQHVILAGRQVSALHELIWRVEDNGQAVR